jgi:hypothetical protein
VGEPHTEDAPRPRRRLWLRVVGVLVLLLVAGVVFRMAINNRQARSQLQALLDALDTDDPDWRLEQIEDGRAEIPAAENGARVVVNVRRLTGANWLPDDLYKALDAVPPQEQLPPELHARLAEALDRVAPAVREARRLAGMPRGRFAIKYEKNPIRTLFDDQQHARGAVFLLDHDARRLAQDGDMKAALASCRAAFNSGRSLGDEPLGISQLIRSACVSAACREVERVLAQGEPGEEDLALIQRLAEDEDRFPSLLVIFRGERAAQHHLYRHVESGQTSLDGVTPPSSGLLDTFLGWGERGLLRSEERHLLGTLTRRADAARLPIHEQPDAIAALRVEEDRDLPERAFLTRMLLASMDKLCQSSWRKHAHVRCLATLLAVERFRRAEGRWPARLEELVPRFLKAVPLDPFDGKPLRLRRLEDGLIVYSVGEDRSDDGGVLDRKSPVRPGVDLGYQLWDANRRRQPASKPAPKDGA